MSVKQMALVWEYEFGHAEQSIMLALADHAHDDGTEIRPSVARLAWKTGYEDRQVQRILKKLRDEMGLLVMTHQGGGRGNPNVYRIDWTKGVKKSPFVRPPKRVTSDEEKGDTQSLKGDISSINGDIAVSPEPSSLEPSSITPSGGADKPPATDEDEEVKGWHFEEYLREALASSDVPLTRGKARRYTGDANKLLKEGVTPEEIYEACDRVVSEWERIRLTLDDALRDLRNGSQSQGKQKVEIINEPLNPHSEEAQEMRDKPRKREWYLAFHQEVTTEEIKELLERCETHTEIEEAIEERRF